MTSACPFLSKIVESKEQKDKKTEPEAEPEAEPEKKKECPAKKCPHLKQYFMCQNKTSTCPFNKK